MPRPGSWVIVSIVASSCLLFVGGYLAGAIRFWVDAWKVGPPLPRLCTRIRLPMVFTCCLCEGWVAV